MQVLVTTNLLGTLGCKDENNIRHPTPCQRKTLLSEETVRAHMFRSTEDRPYSIKDSAEWKKMTPTQRFEVFVNSFDEGYGVSYITID